MLLSLTQANYSFLIASSYSDVTWLLRKMSLHAFFMEDALACTVVTPRPWNSVIKYSPKLGLRTIS